MSIHGVLAQSTVSDLEQALPWYTALLGRGPDAEPMPGLHEWHLGSGYGLQVWLEPDRAGRSSVVLQESDLDAVAARLTEAGLEHPGVAPITSGRALQLTDPDGNRVVLTGL
ncbi:VOC family protein [Nocardioides nanhaiensis]|uniref:VOC family protein n=1 Tax=Nocardioides nanhaiensis TaxID=1476871 RepID=A0ABP8VY42_9ACTN